jgi:hypothetical protein
VNSTPRPERIERLIEGAVELRDNEINAWKERARLAVTAAYGEKSDQLSRFDDIHWTLSFWSDSTPRSAHAEARQRGLKRAVEMLEAMAEDLEARGAEPALPGLNPNDFHPWVSDVAARLWGDGHTRQAVQTAATSVEGWLRGKLSVHEGSISSIVGSAFSVSDPKPDSPRLRFLDVSPVGSDNWKSAHEGAGAFGRGCFLRIRNLYTHHDGANPQEDLEALAALSILARWVDAAVVQRAPDETSPPAG